MLILIGLALGQEPPPQEASTTPQRPTVVQAGLRYRIDGEPAGWRKVRKVLKRSEVASEQLRRADEMSVISLALSGGALATSISSLVLASSASTRCNRIGGDARDLQGFGLWLADLFGGATERGEARGTCGLGPALLVGSLGLSTASIVVNFKSAFHQQRALRAYQQGLAMNYTDRPGVAWTVTW